MVADWKPKWETALDGVVFATITLGLALLHVLIPIELHNALVFDHSEPRLWALWTSAYVHADLQHLVSNLLGFGMAILPTWFVFRWRGRQPVPRRLVLMYLVVFPVVLAVASFGFYQFLLGADAAATRGFSGIVGAIFGLLFVAVLEIVYDLTDWRGVTGVGMAVLLVAMLQMLLRAGAATVPVIALGLVGVVLSVTLVVPRTHPREWVRMFKGDSEPISLAGFGTLVVVVVLPHLFPIRWIQPNQVIDIFGHAAGVALGIISGIIVCWYCR